MKKITPETKKKMRAIGGIALGVAAAACGAKTIYDGIKDIPLKEENAEAAENAEWEDVE